MARKGENIYKRKDGRWEGRYIKSRKKDGRIHYGYIYGRSYHTVRHQLNLMKALHQEQYTYYHSQSFKGTVEQWGRHWLSMVQRDIKPSTYAGYHHKMTHYIFPYAGSIMLNQLSAATLNQWLHSLAEVLAVSSVRVVAQVFNQCMNAAVKQKLLVENPCAELVLPKAPPNSISALTKQEQGRLKQAAIQDPLGLPVIMALETGMRIGELAGLQWEDIDLSTRTLQVRRTLQRIQCPASQGARTQVITGAPKSPASYRIIPLSTALYHYLKQQKRTALGPYVFGGLTPLEPRTLTYRFKRICQRSGMIAIRFHALRHTFATRCLEKRVPITTISALLGHQSIKLTLDTYTSTFLSEKRKAIHAIS